MAAKAEKITLGTKKTVKPYLILSWIYKVHHILFGLDFGFFSLKSGKIKVFVKVISILQCFIYGYWGTWDMFFPVPVHRKIFWYAGVMMHYIICVTYLSFVKSDTNFLSFLNDLKAIDRNLKIDTAMLNLDTKILIVTIFSVLYRFIVTYVYCLLGHCTLSFWNRILITFILESTDFILITYTIVYYAIQCRFTKLISTLENDFDCDIVLTQRIYMSLVDLTEKHKSIFDVMFLTALLSNIPETMSAVFFSVIELLRKHTTSYSPLEWGACYATVVAALVLTFTPAVYAGKLTTQTFQMKVLLYNKLILQRDELRIREIERFIRYLGARGCRFRVWMVIPLDASLIGMVLSFCVTYLIVIIQFTDHHTDS